MANIGSSRTDSGSSGIKPVKSPVVINVVTDVLANTETNFTVSAIKRLAVTNRGSVIVKLTYASGQSGVAYYSILPGVTYTEENIDDQTVVVYLQAPAASQRLEVITWS